MIFHTPPFFLRRYQYYYCRAFAAPRVMLLRLMAPVVLLFTNKNTHMG